MYRIIVDTNVLINGVQDEESYTYKIIEACIGGKMQALISRKIKKENERLTNRLINNGEYFDLLEEYYKTCEIVNPQKKLNVVEDDYDDNKFVEAGVEGGADFIVTNDSDLLDMDDYEGVRMITPEQLWNMYADESDENSSWNIWADGIQD